MKRSVVANGRRIDYTLIQSNRTNVLFLALPERGIQVYAPKYLRLRDVDDMVRQRSEELNDMQRQVEQKLEANHWAHPVTDGSPILIEGKRRTLRLHRGARTEGRLEGEEYHLTLPKPDSDPHVRAAIRATQSMK